MEGFGVYDGVHDGVYDQDQLHLNLAEVSICRLNMVYGITKKSRIELDTLNWLLLSQFLFNIVHSSSIIHILNELWILKVLIMNMS